MSNSFHFSESAIIANYALKHQDPPGRGIESGYKHLMMLRRNKVKTFSKDKFDRYAASYKVIAKAMVEEYLKFEEERKQWTDSI